MIIKGFNIAIMNRPQGYFISDSHSRHYTWLAGTLQWKVMPYKVFSYFVRFFTIRGYESEISRGRRKTKTIVDVRHNIAFIRLRCSTTVFCCFYRLRAKLGHPPKFRTNFRRRKENVEKLHLAGTNFRSFNPFQSILFRF